MNLGQIIKLKISDISIPVKLIYDTKHTHLTIIKHRLNFKINILEVL